jgi:hypothetical protein
MTGEPTLDDVRALFPQWEIWTGISGLVYARRSAAGHERHHGARRGSKSRGTVPAHTSPGWRLSHESPDGMLATERCW